MATLLFTVGVYLALTIDEGGWGLMYFVAAVVQTFPWVLMFVGARRHPWAVRIDSAGVTWSDSTTHRPWSEVAELRVVRPRRALAALRMPGVRLVSHAEADFAARASSRPAGYLIDARQVQATPEEMVAAISRFVRLPIVDE
jgi:hypothetical protein